VCLAALAVAVAVGCAKTGRPGTVKAGGQVTYKGQPLAGATVTFVPQSGKGAAVGMTDASGRFSLMTSGGDGAFPGAYKVTITKTDQPEGQATPQKMDAEAMQKLDMEMMKKARSPSSQPKDLLPIKYKTADKTPLTSQVEASGKNDFQLDLAD